MADSLISTVDLVLLDKMRFQATNARGVAAILDSPLPFGDGLGLTPMEFLLAGLAGCTAMDVISILRKKRLEVTEYRVQVMGGAYGTTDEAKGTGESLVIAV